MKFISYVNYVFFYKETKFKNNYEYSHSYKIYSTSLDYLAEFFQDFEGIPQKDLVEIISDGGITLNADTRVDGHLSTKYIYLYNDFLDDSIEDELPTLPQLNPCNSVKMLKTDFLELNQQWLDKVIPFSPEYILLWQDKDLQVYLETFNQKDTLDQRINKIKRVVGFIEVEDD